MTGPAFPQDAAGPQDAAPDSSSEAVVNNANRLGLQWQLRPATVDVGGSSPMATYDGDSVSISMTSMIGGVTAGQRVFAITVPPSGNFICGSPNGTFLARQKVLGNQATVNFLVPSALRRLQVTWSARCSNAATITDVRMTINGVGANYFTEVTIGNGTTTTSQVIDIATASGFIGYASGATGVAGRFGSGTVNIQNWDNTATGISTWTLSAGTIDSGALQLTGFGQVIAAKPYTTIKFAPGAGASFVAGSDFQVEGWPS